MALLNNIQQALAPDMTDNNNKPTTLEQDTLKVLVGLLGVSLPFILWFGIYAYNDHPAGYAPLQSISHYYYTRMSSWFVVTLSLLAVILIVYRGKSFQDVWLSTVAGLCALLVVLLPTSNLVQTCGDSEHLYSVTYIPPTSATDLRTKIHFISAGLFLSCLAVISLWRFPKTDTSPQFAKNQTFYTWVYRACGVVMLVSLIGILMGSHDIILNGDWFDGRLGGFGTFVGEAIAVFAFGYSWLLNAGFFTKVKQFVFGDMYTG
jgi:hypothetical protein